MQEPFSQGNSAVFLFYAYARILAGDPSLHSGSSLGVRRIGALSNCSWNCVPAKRCTPESIQRKSGIEMSSIPETCLEAEGDCVSITTAGSADQLAGEACVGEGSCARVLSRPSFPLALSTQQG